LLSDAKGGMNRKILSHWFYEIKNTKYGVKMDMKKMVCRLMLLISLILVPTLALAQAEVSTQAMPATEPSFFIEAYSGIGTSSLSDNNTAVAFTGNYYTYFMGGLKLGYWFTPQGTHALSFCNDWTKYFGFYTDFSYQSLNHPNNIVTTYGTPLTTGSSFGNLFTWAFMFAARYGFMPDNVVPFGRLQPYVAVGPAIFFSNQDFNIGGLTQGAKGSTNVGLGVESGLRYFVASNVSFEASFKYRNFCPSYYFSPLQTYVSSYTHLFSGQLGLAYHF
jgi:opacity protein-like surface antigen